MIDCREVLMLMMGVEQIKGSAAHYITLSSLSDLNNSSRTSQKEMFDNIVNWLDTIKRSALNLPLSRSFLLQLKDVTKYVKDDTQLMIHFYVTFSSISKSLIAELGENIFLLIPKDDRRFFDQSVPIFGRRVSEMFPSVSDDIASAGRCFSLNEHTACVFHLMRATERGLHAFSLHLNPKSNPCYENWHNIIQQIEKQIRLLDQSPRGQKKAEKLKFYSEASVQFLYIKDAWRNHVSHSRETYNRSKSKQVMNAVGAFLGHLADHGIGD